ncbi:MAG: hypothetical protein KKB13_01685 [Chloroflexi bacterium]|nr:hypothetical protein [Chloroflexota bacterium]
MDKDREREQVERELERASELAPLAAVPADTSPVPWTPPPLPAPPPEIAAWNERWERFEAADRAAKIAMFEDILAAGEMDAEMAYEGLSLLWEASPDPADRAECRALLARLQQEAPDIYRHDAPYYAAWLIDDALAQGHGEALPELLEPFAENPDRDIDGFFRIIHQFMYHGHNEPLRQAMARAWPQVQGSGEIMSWGQDEFLDFLTSLTIFAYLDQASSPSADDPALSRMLAPYGDLREEYVRDVVEALSRTEPRAWSVSDFDSSASKKRREENLLLLLWEFAGEWHRRDGAPLCKADLGRRTLLDYLAQRQEWGRARRGLAGLTYLLPDRASLDPFLAGKFGIFGAQPYEAGCLFELLPAYVGFLTHRGLAAPEEAAARLAEIAGLWQDVQKVLWNWQHDPTLRDNVAAAWAEVPVAVAPRQRAAQQAPRRAGPQVYRFRASLRRRPGTWREFEIRSDQTLGALDGLMRSAFGHDWSDHLSEFYRPGIGSRDEGFGSHQPFGGGEGDRVRIDQVGVDVGDKLKYVYDFGDWIEHVVEVVDITDPAPGVEYPREVARSKGPQRYCADCQKLGQKTRAVYFCRDCTSEQRRDVYLCANCASDLHEEHDVDEIVD